MIKAKKSVIESELYIFPTPFKEVLEKCNLTTKDVLKLDYNEPTVPPSPSVRKALIDYINKGKLQWYPRGDCKEVMDELSNYTKISSDKIIVGNGSDEILKVIANTFLSRCDEVIVPIPNYSMFIIDSRLVGAKIIQIPLYGDLKARQIIEKVNDKTRVIYLSNPNSPLGYLIEREEIMKILESAKNVLLIIDEAYFEFCNKTVIDLVEKYDNLIVVRTLSKAFSLASFRIGYAAANVSIINELNKVKDPESVNSLAQIAAINALKDIKYREKFISEILKSREYLKNELTKLGLKVWPSQANFLFVTFPCGINARIVWKSLEKRGIFLRERTKVIENSLRISIPKLEESKRLINEIKKEIRKETFPLLIFDIDGVLVDVSNSYRKAIKKTVFVFTKKLVTDLNIQELKNKTGFNNDWDLTEELIRKQGITIEKEIIIEKFQYFYMGDNRRKGLIDNERWIMDKTLLKELSKKYDLIIFTGRPKKEAEYVLEKNNVGQFFTRVISLEDVKKSKPDPEGLNGALSYFKKTNAFYFGDTSDDMRVALYAKIIPIGVLRPNAKTYERDILIEAGACKVIKNINKINEVLK